MDKSVSIPVIVAVMWIINFGISFWNARVVGLIWVEAKQIGGFANFLKWCGAIMAYCGFLWCYVIVEAFVGHWLFPDTVTAEVMNGMFALSYLIIIFPVLGTGFAIWATSLYQAWVRRDFASIGTAAWNTFAQVHNTYQAFEGVPKAASIVGDLFSGKSKGSSDKNGAAALVVVLLVALAAIAAFFTTAGIIMKYAGTRPLPGRSEERRGGGMRRAT